VAFGCGFETLPFPHGGTFHYRIVCQLGARRCQLLNGMLMGMAFTFNVPVNRSASIFPLRSFKLLLMLEAPSAGMDCGCKKQKQVSNRAIPLCAVHLSTFSAQPITFRYPTIVDFLCGEFHCLSQARLRRQLSKENPFFWSSRRNTPVSGSKWTRPERHCAGRPTQKYRRRAISGSEW
jgi:hypothetical protein